LLAAAALLGHAQVTDAASRSITPADIVEAEVVGGPILSDSGNWLAYTVNQSLIEQNKRDAGVYLVEVDGGSPSRLLGDESPAYAPQWIPGQDVLTFLAPSDDGNVEVFSYRPATAQVSQVTDLNRPIAGFRWSPDALSLALVLPDQPEIDPRWEGLQAPWVIDRQQFKQDGTGYLDRSRTHIYALDIADGNLMRLTHGDYDNASPVWSPDGGHIAFASNRTANPDSNGDIDIWIMPPVEGDAKLTLVSRSDDMDWSPVWSPNGRYLAYSTYEQPEYFYFSLRKIEVHDLESGETTMVAEGLDRSISAPAFSQDSGRLYFVLESEGSYNLAYTDVSDMSKVLPVTTGENSIIRYDLSQEGSIAVRNAG
jgi:Tol biopolymer transport system component